MQAHATHTQLTHEAERFARATIAFTAIWVLVFSGILAVVAVFVFNARIRGLPQSQAPVVRAQAQPRGEVSNVRVDLFAPQGPGQALKAEQQRRLSQYGWVDRQAGLVHVPIDVAMELELAEQH
jgi:hypothetical protein